jgi:hypothetical protein
MGVPRTSHFPLQVFFVKTNETIGDDRSLGTKRTLRPQAKSLGRLERQPFPRSKDLVRAMLPSTGPELLTCLW